ncbi:DNA primase, large subunit [Choiromyces venosus 120613-1]|uniref:DNA primase large subunit n=1 Tax=Choiromyces venosus 120613-1 TaxID=1336337 RepID=A0A3N4JD16_9PEZI|nr:DNA primase, large subunit [Choiromyces venosus 120613-1]
MFRQESVKRVRAIDSKKHWASTGAEFNPIDYTHRLNFYNTPPTTEITLDEFEQWAIDRLRILGEIESCLYRNMTLTELTAIISKLDKDLFSLSANTAKDSKKPEQRRKDHYSHYILRLAFARSEDLRKRFVAAETVLFKLRYNSDDSGERQEFIESLGFDWELLSAGEKAAMRADLLAGTGTKSPDADAVMEDGFFKVDWERVYDLVDQRKVLLRGGKAYVPNSQQPSLVFAEFSARLEKALELTARALPRLDEDDRLIPILDHLSRGFAAPEYNTSMTATTLNGASLTAAVVDDLAQYFPMCMRQLHTTLRREKKLLHNGRLQYTLFLKGVGLSVDEAVIFWRKSFSRIDDDRFQKEYRYNIRHAYGLEGTRRNYKPLSCQQILTERRPAANQVHGCPYREVAIDNLVIGLAAMGVSDRDVIRHVREDVEAKKYHVACTRVFEYSHAKELKREKEAAGGMARFTENIIHPNEYFTRSFGLKNPGSLEGVADTATATTGTASGGGDGQVMEMD